MPIIQVAMVKGRPGEVRRKLAAALTEAAVEALGAPRQTVRVLISEIEPENFVVAGVPKSDPSPGEGS